MNRIGILLLKNFLSFLVLTAAILLNDKPKPLEFVILL